VPAGVDAVVVRVRAEEFEPPDVNFTELRLNEVPTAVVTVPPILTTAESATVPANPLVLVRLTVEDELPPARTLLGLGALAARLNEGPGGTVTFTVVDAVSPLTDAVTVTVKF
jgi:hypothetical protein